MMYFVEICVYLLCECLWIVEYFLQCWCEGEYVIVSCDMCSCMICSGVNVFRYDMFRYECVQVWMRSGMDAFRYMFLYDRLCHVLLHIFIAFNWVHRTLQCMQKCFIDFSRLIYNYLIIVLFLYWLAVVRSFIVGSIYVTLFAISRRYSCIVLTSSLLLVSLHLYYGGIFIVVLLQDLVS